MKQGRQVIDNRKMKHINTFYEQRPAWERANKSGHIRLVRDFCFWVDCIAYWVPNGYVCNGASIPRPLWSIIGSPFDPMNAEFAWVHDPGYLTHAFTREQTDDMAYCIALQSGNSEAKAHAIWVGVRAFADLPGISAWKNNEQDKKDLLETRTMIINRTDCDKFKSLWWPEQK